MLLSLLGAIALCLFGMKVMSQGLLQITGSRVRATLRAISQSRLHCFGVGAEVTMLLQSSSSMTLMAVSSVNAGLMTLAQSTAVIMGANVGTAFTAWVIAVLGYAYPCTSIAVPLIVLALPFTYSVRIKKKPWGEVLMGASLMLLGFCTFIEMMPEASAGGYPSVAAALQVLTSAGFWSALLFVAMGVVVTMLLQSSVATIMLAMVLCASGWLPLTMAMALVIGDNVGTTLTAIFASRKANVSARRAAYAHLLFNLFGLVWALPLVYPISSLSASLMGGNPVALACSIALFHTLFNLLTALVLIVFQPQFDALLCRIKTATEDEEEEFHLSFIHGGMLSTAELSVDEARKETVQFGLRCQRMLDLTLQFIRMAPKGDDSVHLFSRIEKYEKITDRLELEIVRYLNELDKSNITPRAAARIRSIFRMVDELESIGDACYKLARTIVRRNDAGVIFIQMQQNNIERMLGLMRQDIDLMVQLMEKNDLTPADMNRAYNQEDLVNSLRNQLRDQNIEHVQAGHYTYQSGVLYMDLISGCEKLCDYIINVIEALAEQNNIPAREDDDPIIGEEEE
ncbi:MAG: Na/Pi cotransporter family protein [Bacteroidales bacterium]|nr:Na/Pi cotransporter family protein [Candidatus Liminaster caballi]